MVDNVTTKNRSFNRPRRSTVSATPLKAIIAHVTGASHVVMPAGV